MTSKSNFGSGPFLLVLDESTNTDLTPNTSSLTGLLIPVNMVAVVRHGFYTALRDFLIPKPNHLGRPPEIHFSDLLRGHSDDVKHRIVKDLAQLVRTHELVIFRVAYYLTPEVNGFLSFDRELTSLNWFGMQTVIQPVLREAVVIPIVDGGFDAGFKPIAEKFAEAVKSCDMLRAADLGGSLSIRNTENLCEVAFSDSRHSVLVQLADVVAGLRRLAETARLSSNSISSFKRSILELGKPLEECVYYDETIELEMHTG